LRDDVLFVIGEITGVHGLKGYVRVHSFADAIDSFVPGMEVLIRPKKGGPVKKQRPQKRLAHPVMVEKNEQGDIPLPFMDQWYEIERVSPHKKGVLLMFQGIDREGAETLVGSELFMNRNTLPELEADTYYWQDLIGLTVVDIRHGELGRLDHILPTGSNDVYVVKGTGREVLVPALAWVVKSVDFEKGEMLIDLPDALFD
jgi:16S rRNA processing protein RimM